VVVVDSHGAVLDDFRLDDTADGWQPLRERLGRYPHLAVAIETSSGAAVERLMQAGYAVFPVNPKAAKRYRERQAPSGTKTDRLDAWSLADALRLDGGHWRPLQPDHPLTVELRRFISGPISAAPSVPGRNPTTNTNAPPARATPAPCAA
jgi:transposase